MPLSESEILQLKALGLNPDEYAPTEELEQIQEPVAQVPPVTPEAPDWKTTVARSMARSAPAALAGSGAVAAVGKGLSLIPHPIPKVAGIGLQLGAGTLTAGATKALMDKAGVTPFQSSEQADQLNPKANIAGNVLANVAGGMNPSVGNLLSAGRSIAKIPTAARLAQSEVANLLNVGVGATLPPAIEIGRSLYQTGEIPPVSELLLNAAGGALFSEPNKLGRMMGFQPTKIEAPLKWENTGNKVEAPPAPPSLGKPVEVKTPINESPIGRITNAKEAIERYIISPDVVSREGVEYVQDLAGAWLKNKETGKITYSPRTTVDQLTPAGFERVTRVPVQMSDPARPTVPKIKDKVSPLKSAKESIKVLASPEKIAKENQDIINKAGGRIGQVDPGTVKSFGAEYPVGTQFGETTGKYINKIGADPVPLNRAEESARAILEAQKQREAELLQKTNAERAETPSVETQSPENVEADFNAQKSKTPDPATMGARYQEESTLKGSQDQVAKDNAVWEELRAALAENPKGPINRRFIGFNATKVRQDNGLTYGYKFTNPHTGEVLYMADPTKPLSKHSNLAKAWVSSGEYPINKPKVDPDTRQQPASEINSQLDQKGIPSTPLSGWASLMEKLGQTRNVKVEQDNTISDPSTGKPIAGVTWLRKGLQQALAKVSPDRAGLDTGFHELLHVFRDDLHNGPSQTGKNLAQMFDNAVAQSPEFQAAKAKNPSLTVEEFGVSETGKATVSRALNLDDETQLGRYARDVWAFMKHKFGPEGSASLKDYQRLMSNKLLNDPSFTETHGSVQVKPVTETGEGEVKQQGESEISAKLKLEYDKRIAKGMSHEKALKAAAEELEWSDPNSPEFFEPSKKLPSIETDKLAKELIEADFAKSDWYKPEQNSAYFKPSKGSLFDGTGVLWYEDGTIDTQAVRPEYLNSLAKTDSNRILEILGEDKGLKWLAEASKYQQEPRRLKSDIRMQRESELRRQASAPGVAPTTTKPTETFKAPFTLTGTRSAIDVVYANNTPEAKVAGDAFTNFYKDYDANKGKYVESVVKPLMKLLKLDEFSPISKTKQFFSQTNESDKRLAQYAWEMYHLRKSSVKLTPTEQQAYDTRQKYFMDVVIPARKARPGMQPSEGDPYYNEDIMDRSVAAKVFNDPNSSEAKVLMKDFADFQGPGWEKIWEEVKSKYKNQNSNIAEQFGPLDKPSGKGLPFSWIDKSFVSGVSRYGDRVARRIAYYDQLQPDIHPEVQNAFNKLPSKDINDVMDDVTGAIQSDERIINGISRVIRAGRLGPLTGLKDFESGFFLGLQHTTPGMQVKAAANAISNFSENLAESFIAGANSTNLMVRELGEAGSSDIAQNLETLASALSRLSGRQSFEQAIRGINYGMGKYLGMALLEQAKRGKLDAQGRKFLNDLAPKGWESYVETGEFPPEVLMAIGREYVASVQGTYNYRGLPVIAKNHSLAPFLLLAKWDIEKANNFTKFVINPALQGDFRPLLYSTLGMVMGATIVNETVELVTGRKNKQAKAGEIMEAAKQGNNVAPEVFYKLAAASSAAGYGGMLMSTAKAIADLTYGKTKPQAYENITVDFAAETADSVAKLVTAINEGADLTVVGDFLNKIAADNLQAYRILMTHLSDEQKQRLDKSNKFRDLRTFNRLEGRPLTDLRNITQANQFEKKDEKKFKQTEDLEEAAGLVPQLVQDAYDRAKGDPEQFKANLRSLKGNSYQTMPNPDNQAATFVKFYEFLEATQGKEEAKRRLEDYLTRNAVNKAKSSMIP